MAYDLNDLWGWIQRLVRRVERLESGAMLENASITNGRLRIISGTLRVDSGGRLEVVGTVQIDGTTTVTGTFNVSGPWNLTGNGTITGATSISGNVTITGDLTLAGSGKFTSGNVRIEGGRVYVGAGGNLIVIDGATGKITAGSLTIDPASNGGSVKFAGGPEVYASEGMLSLYSTSGGAFAELGSVAKLSGPGTRWVEVNGSGFTLVGLPTRASSLARGAAVGTVWSDTSGNLYRVIAD